MIFTSSPLTDLTEDEEKVLTYEKKYLWLILALIGINILCFYLVYYFVGGNPNDNRLLLSFTTILGIASLFGFLLGLVISLFPYQNFVFADKYKRGTLLGQLITHGIIAVTYVVTLIMMLMKK